MYGKIEIILKLTNNQKIVQQESLFLGGGGYSTVVFGLVEEVEKYYDSLFKHLISFFPLPINCCKSLGVSLIDLSAYIN